METKVKNAIKSLEAFKAQLETYTVDQIIALTEDRGDCLFSDYVYGGEDYSYRLVQSIGSIENVAKLIEFLKNKNGAR